MSNRRQTMISYLLGELSDDEQVSLEMSYFRDPNVFAELVTVENDLVDRYATNTLSHEERGRFESHYLAHRDRTERAKFAFALRNRTISPEEVERSSWWSLFTRRPLVAYGATIAAGCLLIVLALLINQTLRLRNELHQAQSIASEQQRTHLELEQEIMDEAQRLAQASKPMTAPLPGQAPSPSPPATRAVVLALTIGGTRAPGLGPAARIRIASGIEEVLVRLTLQDDGYSAYEVVIQPVGGSPLLDRKGLRTSRATLAFAVPASAFAGGDYMLTLKGVTATHDIEEVSKSLFRVEHK